LTAPEHRPLPLTKDGGAVFDEPWQAQTLALADGLVQAGYFSPAQWAEALGAELKKADTSGAPDTTETYYQAALAALEALTAAHADIPRAQVTERRNDWERAYLATPHGKPVLLSAEQKVSNTTQQRT
jgi:nitrile hydratase accessory protein